MSMNMVMWYSKHIDQERLAREANKRFVVVRKNVLELRRRLVMAPGPLAIIAIRCGGMAKRLPQKTRSNN
jgi:hypothetical protein